MISTDRITDRRHPEWQEHELRWRWLLDSFESGDRYRFAVYGTDSRGFPRRNLVRHKREYPAPGEEATDWTGWRGTDPSVAPTDDDYALRLIRTPVPDFVAEAVRKHLGRIYRHEVKRTGPSAYESWAQDVDGSGTPLDAWMRQTVAPLLLVLGQLDVVMDHPVAPAGETVATEADVLRLDLKAVRARVVMPWDVVWWRLDARKRYDEALVREWAEGKNGKPEEQFRLWTKAGWTLYAANGQEAGRGVHPFGVVPLTRLFVGRKHRCEHTGLSPLESVAERQREYYNRDSELILSDVIQAHPMIQGPEDALDGGTLSIGPGWLLPKKKSMSGGQATYEGFDVIDFPKGAADSIRSNLDRLRDDVDRSQALAKPAGSDGGSVVAQSGISKSFDHADRNDMLSDLADALQAAELELGRLASRVGTDGADDGSTVSVAYSRQFDLRTGDELAASLQVFQEALASAGRAPALEARVLGLIVREDLLPGLEDADYAEIDAEIFQAIEEASQERKAGLVNAIRAAAGAGPVDPNDPYADPMSDDPTLA